jgi:hypothetical protein
MSARSAARVVSAFMSTLGFLGAAAPAFAEPAQSAQSALTVSAVVFTRCSVDAASAPTCSAPTEVQRQTSAVQTVLVDGQPRRVVIATVLF